MGFCQAYLSPRPHDSLRVRSASFKHRWAARLCSQFVSFILESSSAALFWSIFVERARGLVARSSNIGRPRSLGR